MQDLKELLYVGDFSGDDAVVNNYEREFSSDSVVQSNYNYSTTLFMGALSYNLFESLYLDVEDISEISENNGVYNIKIKTYLKTRYVEDSKYHWYIFIDVNIKDGYFINVQREDFVLKTLVQMLILIAKYGKI